MSSDETNDPRSVSRQRSRSPLLIDAKAVAELLGRSERSIWRDDEEGRIPAAISLGGSKRWRIKEIRAWVRRGCPDRSIWEAHWSNVARPHISRSGQNYDGTSGRY